MGHPNFNSESGENYGKVFYETTSMCPECETILPAEVASRNGGVYVIRKCPEHGKIEGLACSDVSWFERLSKFDVEPLKPKFHNSNEDRGCPQDCGLCPSHRQSAGTAAIEISNKCNLFCPVCLADNQATFELSVEQVKTIADDFLANQPSVDALTVSGGEPTIHPKIFEILRELDRTGISRIVLNSNGIRIAEDDVFLDELSRHPKVYVSLHHDGKAAKKIRGLDFSIQEKALERLLKWKIKVVPLVLAVKNENDRDLGKITMDLLTKSPAVKSVFLSMMAYSGPRGSSFAGDPKTRLTIPEALARIEEGTDGAIKGKDFMPLPMPNPMCASIGYFMVLDKEVIPLISLLDEEKVISFTKNSHFVRAEGELQTLLKETIDRIFSQPGEYLNPEKLLKCFRQLLQELYPEGKSITVEQRRKLAEERIKTVYLMQFMDAWTFDSVRLAKCSCQHLLPDKKVVPSCGYYTYHRKAFAKAILKN